YHGSHHRRFVHRVHAADTHPAFRHRLEAFHLAAPAQAVEETKVPGAVFASLWASTRPQGTEPRTHRSRRRNETAEPPLGCPRIAQQISLAFSVEIDKDVVRRILTAHYRPESDSAGPSWLTFIGHSKDRLWSCDLFRCESAMLRSYWVLVV